MNRDDIRNAIQGFVTYVEEPGKKESEVLLALIDKLFAARHAAQYVFDETDYPDPAKTDVQDLATTISGRFPEYGFYNIPEHVVDNVGDSQCMIGDAIDDLTDIYRDMKDILWCWDNNSPDDALWHFENGYMTHWGHHMRDLQFYLFKRLCG